TPDQVLKITSGWADRTWEVGIAFGTVGLRKDSAFFEITTYRSEQYERTSRRPDVRYGTSLEDDLGRRDFTVNAMAARLPDYEFTDPFGGFEALRERVLRTPGPPERSRGELRGQAGVHGGGRRARRHDRPGGPAGDRVRGADHQRADQADADPRSGPWRRRPGADRRGRRGAARGVQAPDGGRRAPPAQGRLPAQPHRAAAGDRPGAGVRAG